MELSKIPKHVLRDVTQYVRENRLYPRPAFGRLDDAGIADAVTTHIGTMSPREVFTAYLEWNGIIGFADDFWDVVTELSK